MSVSRTPLPPSQCSGRFVATDFPHEIEVDSPRVFNFESLGAGLALGDNDNDSDIDLVLANLDGATIILWNEPLLPHGPRFRPQELTSDPTAGVVAADVDGDGWLDLALTHPKLVPSLYRNAAADSGHREFIRDREFGAGYHAYVLDWGDLDGDGDPDLVTATYDRLLLLHYGFVAGGGLAFYENTEDGLDASLLIPGADALALLLADLDGDRRPEIVVGNDYARRDYVLTRDPAIRRGWRERRPFTATAMHTMSYDAGDVDNDGRFELFAADMKPYRDDAAVRQAWGSLRSLPSADGVQTDANVLLVAGDGGSYQDRAAAAGVDATGWSWSAKFGDLDSDGALDLYVVNGFIAVEVFGHLAGDELVEENQARRGDGAGGFVPAPQWGLASTRSGRGMSMADLDGDGDLDIVVSNLRAPSQLFENRLCGGGNPLVDLRQPHTGNTHAVGARVDLVHASGLRQTRVVRVQSGYLSGDTSRLHSAYPPATRRHAWQSPGLTARVQ